MLIDAGVLAASTICLFGAHQHGDSITVGQQASNAASGLRFGGRSCPALGITKRPQPSPGAYYKRADRFPVGEWECSLIAGIGLL
jgi:hypothetical protein